MHFLVQITPESLLELVKLHGSKYAKKQLTKSFKHFMNFVRTMKSVTRPSMLLNLLFAVHIVHCGVEIGNIPELRWYLFCKHRAESDRLPPTLGSLEQHILRAHLRAQIWGQPKAATQSF